MAVHLSVGWNQGTPAKGESPLDYLMHAVHCYACAIKNRPKDSNLHLQLGLVLEERYLAEDIFGLKPSVSSWIIDKIAIIKFQGFVSTILPSPKSYFFLCWRDNIMNPWLSQSSTLVLSGRKSEHTVFYRHFTLKLQIPVLFQTKIFPSLE